MITRPAIYLTWMSMRMWSRDRAALFWTFFLPLVIMVIFGLLNFGELGKVDIGIVDLAQNEASARFIEEAGQVEALRVTVGDEAEERAALEDGQRDLIVVLPPNFGPSVNRSRSRMGTHDDSGPISRRPARRVPGRFELPSVGR